MELKRKKYSKKEVEHLLDAEKKEYDRLLFNERSKAIELADDNLKLSVELNSIKNKEKEIASALEYAEKTSSEMTKQINIAYALELARIKSFSKRWNEYFSEIYKKYPLDKEVKNSLSILEKTLSTEQCDENKKTIDSINKIFDEIEDENFNPKKKILDYIASTGDNGFNMDEVLNPGKLELGDLCKELGLMEESE